MKTHPACSTVHKRNYTELYTKAGLLFGISVLLFVLLKVTLFCDGQEYIDDVTLFNPIYNYLHHGRLVYPAFGYPDSVSVHPPMHYYIIAVLMKWGLSKKLAQSFLVILFTVGIAIWAYKSNRNIQLRLSVLFALCWLLFSYTALSIRPDFTITAGLIFGYLLIFESLSDDSKKAFLITGVFIVSAVSYFHYYAWSASSGLIVALYYTYKNYSGNRRTKYAQIILPFLMISSAYFVFIFFPDYANIKEAFAIHQTDINIRNSVSKHFMVYNEFLAHGWLTYPMRLVEFLHIPLFLFSIAIALFLKEIRILVWLSLPFTILLFLFAQHKGASYIQFEIFISCISVLCAIFYLFEYLSGGILTLFVWGVFFTVAIWIHYRYREIVLHPVPQAELARWYGKSINGNSTLISGGSNGWYIGGANRYGVVLEHQIIQDIISHSYKAVNLFFMDSKGMPSTRQPALAEWYLEGKLKLHGFFATAKDIETPYLLYSDTLSFFKGMAYFGNHNVYTYTPSDSDGFYFVTALDTIDAVYQEKQEMPCFYQEFHYSVLHYGQELYQENLRGKKLVWGVLNKHQLDNLQNSATLRIIDTLKVACKKIPVPDNLQQILYEKPPVEILLSKDDISMRTTAASSSK